MKLLAIFILFFGIHCYSIQAKESIYYLHGFMRSASSMKHMAKPFHNRGYHTYLWDYPSRKYTIEEHAEALVQDLRKTAIENPGQPIHFVTHSLGGIILRAALNHPHCPTEAKQGKAVLLSPPNQGSIFARNLHNIGLVRKILGEQAGKQLLTSKSFDYLGNFPETLNVLIISGTLGWNPFIEGKNDGKVGVTESYLETPHRHIFISCGHSWMMFSRTVIKLALQFIID